jgi:hypothetical protein
LNFFSGSFNQWVIDFSLTVIQIELLVPDKLVFMWICEFPIGSYVKLSSAVQPSWSESGTTRHNFGRGPSNDYFIKVWYQLSNWFQTRRLNGPLMVPLQNCVL